MRFYISLPLHQRFSKLQWYKKWHERKFSHAMHVFVLGMYILSVVFSFLAIPSESYAALEMQTKTVTTSADFEKGVLDSTQTNGNQLELTPDNFDGLSNNGGGSWQFAVPITISNVGGSSQSQYPLRLTLNTQALVGLGKMQSDGDDIRFTSSNRTTELSYYLESGINTPTTVVWIKVPTVAAPPITTTIYLFYGNSSATTSSSATQVFDFFDDFTSLAKWTVTSSTYFKSTNNTLQYIGGTSSINHKAYITTPPSLEDFTVEYDIQADIVYRNSYWSGIFAGDTYDYYNTLNKINVMAHYGGSISDTKGSIYGPSNTRFYPIAATWYHVKFKKVGVNTVIYIWDNAHSEANPNHTSTTATAPLTQYDNFGVQQRNTVSGEYGYIDNFKIYKAVAIEPVASLGTEEVIPSGYLQVGTYTSPSDSNTIDFNWNGGWGDSITNFEADVVIPTANESISFEARTSADKSNWTDWENIGTATETGTFVDNGNMDNLATLSGDDNYRYIQVRSTFASSDGLNTPILTEYRIVYYTDLNPPVNPTAAAAYTDSSKNTLIDSDSWTNDPEPYLEWTGQSDNDLTESGIDCYYVYFGTDDTADPETAGLDGATCYTDPSIDFATLTTNPLDTAVSGTTYYLRVDTKDKAGNVADMVNGQSIFTYKYDNVAPIAPTGSNKSPLGYTATNSFTFDWTGYQGNDPEVGSGVEKYQYKTSVSSSDWTDVYGTKLDKVSFDPAPDDGENILYIRSVDNAGNASDDQANWYATSFYYSANPPEKPADLTVSPNSNTENSFTFCWNQNEAEDMDILKYQYSVNTTPTSTNVSNIFVTPVPENGNKVSDGLLLDSVCPGTSSTYDYVYGPKAAAQVQAPESNTFYLVAYDTLNNVSYDSDHWATIQYQAQTTAPGVPLNPIISDISNRDTENWSLAVSWDRPTYFPTGSSYRIYHSTDGEAYTLAGTSTTTTYSEAGLDNTKEYYYKVYAVDNAGSMSDPSDVVFCMPTGKYTIPPTVVAEPEAEATAVTAVVTWTTDRPSSSFVEYSTDTSYNLSNGSQRAATDHSVTLSGLTPGVGYNFRVQSLDEDRNYQPENAYSGNYTFVTSAAPGISEVEVTDVGLTSAILSWKTTSSASSTVKFGVSTSYGSEISDQSGSQVTTHTIRLTDLAHSTVYNFKITGVDVDNNYMESDNYVFTTLTFPKVSNVRFEPLKDTATSTLKVTWTSNVPLTSVVKFRQSDGGGTKELSSAKLVTTHSMIVSDLKDNTDYILSVEGRDAHGNLAVSDPNKIRTDFDTRPPEVSNVTSEVTISGYGLDTRAQVVVYWETDELSTSQVEYSAGVMGETYSYKTQEDSALTTSHVVIISDLKPSTSYHFRAVSNDASSNEGFSEDSSVLTDQAQASVLDMVITTLQNALGWLFGA